MVASNFQVLKDLSENEIQSKLIELKKELFNLRLQKATRQAFKPHKFKEVKHQIAQLMTLQSQRK